MIDDKSRAEIFNQYRRRLFGIAYRMLGTSADSEDVVQEALFGHIAKILVLKDIYWLRNFYGVLYSGCGVVLCLTNR